MQGIYTYIPETNYVPREYGVAAILLLLFMVLISLLSVLNPMYFFICTFRSMCAVPNMAVFCSSLTSWFPGVLLTYFLNVFEIVPVAPIITGYYYYYYYYHHHHHHHHYYYSFCGLKPAKRTPPNISRSKNSNTQRTENNTTDVVIHQHSHKLLKMDILMSETCWAHNKWNKILSDIKLVFHSSTIAMMHGPVHIRMWLICIQNHEMTEGTKHGIK